MRAARDARDRVEAKARQIDPAEKRAPQASHQGLDDRDLNDHLLDRADDLVL
jgi:hypothetical protein